MQILLTLLRDQLLTVREGFRWVSVGDFHAAGFVLESINCFWFQIPIRLVTVVCRSSKCKRTLSH